MSSISDSCSLCASSRPVHAEHSPMYATYNNPSAHSRRSGRSPRRPRANVGSLSSRHPAQRIRIQHQRVLLGGRRRPDGRDSVWHGRRRPRVCGRNVACCARSDRSFPGAGQWERGAVGRVSVARLLSPSSCARRVSRERVFSQWKHRVCYGHV